MLSILEAHIVSGMGIDVKLYIKKKNMKYKNITYCSTRKTYKIKYEKNGVNYYVGSNRDINIAKKMLDRHRLTTNRIKKADIEDDLKKIVDYVSSIYGSDIKEKTRKNFIALYRALATRIINNVFPYASLSEIGKSLNVDHSTVSFYNRKLIKEIELIHKFNKLYIEHPLVLDVKLFKKRKTKEYIRDKYNNLLNKYNKLLLVKTDVNLTQNEKKYRKLTDEQKKKYDETASLKLRSFEWQHNKNEFEIINCSQ